jgi:catechol 2,3-dioxygenase-like lactoylglutathione lyase family enzyme
LLRPPALAHVGITVDDLDRAVRWYTDVIGLRLVAGPFDVRASQPGVGAQATDVFGEAFQRFRQAHLSTANGVALEMFEFVDPPTERPSDGFAYWQVGLSHLCLVDPDIDGLVGRIERSGGRRRTSKVWDIFPGEPYKMCYCEDPFGNVLEIYTHSHEQVFANRRGY